MWPGSTQNISPITLNWALRFGQNKLSTFHISGFLSYILISSWYLKLHRNWLICLTNKKKIENWSESNFQGLVMMIYWHTGHFKQETSDSTWILRFPGKEKQLCLRAEKVAKIPGFSVQINASCWYCSKKYFKTFFSLYFQHFIQEKTFFHHQKFQPLHYSCLYLNKPLCDSILGLSLSY